MFQYRLVVEEVSADDDIIDVYEESMLFWETDTEPGLDPIGVWLDERYRQWASNVPIGDAIAVDRFLRFLRANS